MNVEMERLNLKDGSLHSKKFKDKFYYHTLELPKSATSYSRVFTPASTHIGKYYHIRSDRYAGPEDLKHLNQSLMPGFKVSWSYETDEVLDLNEFHSVDRTQFIRLVNILIRSNYTTEFIWEQVKIIRGKLVVYYNQNRDQVDECRYGKSIVRTRVRFNNAKLFKNIRYLLNFC